MRYGNKTNSYFLIKLTSEENEKVKRLLKKLNTTRREFLLSSIKNYEFRQNKNKKRLLRKELRTYIKATQRFGKRRVSYLLSRLRGKAKSK